MAATSTTRTKSVGNGSGSVYQEGARSGNPGRWVAQVKIDDKYRRTYHPSEAKAKRGTETINGFQVSTVDLTGIYAGGGMSMGQPSVKKPSYRLLGAIIEAPSGPVYFKLTGPEKTIAAAQKEFQELLKSVK